MKEIEIKKLDPQATLPTRAHPNDAGLDLYSVEDTTLASGSGKAIRTGIAVAIADGCVGMIADRSSLGKKGIKVAGGIVDSGYRGEVQVVLWNLSQETVHLKKGERIAQMLILSIQTPIVIEAHALSSTARGSGGFGSTGK